MKQRTIATLDRLHKMDCALDSVIGGLMKVTGQAIPTRSPAQARESLRRIQRHRIQFTRVRQLNA